MIFGNKDDNMTRLGKIDLFKNGKSQVRSGNMIYGDDVSVKSGDMMFSSKGSTVKSGNMFLAPDGTYVRSGKFLYGPNGKSYVGLESDDDAWSIIHHNNE